MRDRLTKDQRRAILSEGATLDADLVYGPEISGVDIQSGQIMRALRVLALLDELEPELLVTGGETFCTRAASRPFIAGKSEEVVQIIHQTGLALQEAGKGATPVGEVS